MEENEKLEQEKKIAEKDKQIEQLKKDVNTQTELAKKSKEEADRVWKRINSIAKKDEEDKIIPVSDYDWKLP